MFNLQNFSNGLISGSVGYNTNTGFDIGIDYTGGTDTNSLQTQQLQLQALQLQTQSKSNSTLLIVVIIAIAAWAIFKA